MTTYTTSIDGKYSLSEIESAIRGEEAGASKFKDSRPSLGPGIAENVVVFDELPPGQMPEAISLKTSGQQAPSQSQKIWTGTMIVQGTSTAVTAYR